MRQPSNASNQVRYDAFLSYNHGDRDVAEAIQQGLHKLARPIWKVRALHIYRDQTHTPASAEMWPLFVDALDRSAWLILVASPPSAASPYVQQEVEQWIQWGRGDRLLFAVVGGVLEWESRTNRFDPVSTSIPSSLCRPGIFHGEGRWVDFRGIPAHERTINHVAMRAAVLDLASPLHGKPKEELDGIDLREQRRLRRYRRGALSSLAVLLVLAVVAAVVAVGQRNEAREQSRIAETRALVAEANGSDDPAVAVAIALDSVVHTGSPLPEATAALFAAAQQLNRHAYIPVGPLIVGIRRDPVATIVWKPDGTEFAAAGGAVYEGKFDSNLVRIWEPTAQGVQPVASLEGHRALVSEVEWSPDGRYLASIDASGTVLVHDGQTMSLLWRGEPDTPVKVDAAITASLAWSGDSTRLATGVDDLVVVREASHGRELSRSVLAGKVGSLDWAPSNLIAVSGEGAVRVLDADSTRPEVLYETATQSYDVRWLDNTRLTGRDDEGVWTWEPAAEGEPVHVDGIEPGDSYSWSGDGSRLAVGRDDGIVDLWQVSGTQAQSLDGPFPMDSGMVTGVAFQPSGSLLLTTAAGGLRLWKPSDWYGQPRLPAASGTGVNLSPAGRYVAVQNSASIQVTDLKTGESTAVMGSPSSWISPTELLVARHDGVFRVNIESGAARQVTALPGSGRVDASPANGRMLVAFPVGDANDSAIAIFDEAGHEIGTSEQRLSGEIVDSSWSPAGTTLAIAYNEGPTILYRGDDLTEAVDLDTAGVTSLSWASGAELVAVSGDGVVERFDARGERLSAAMRLVDVSDLAILGDIALVAALDGVRLVDWRTGATLAEPVETPETADGVTGVAADQVSRRLVAVVNGKLFVWDLVPAAELCEVALQPLSDAEIATLADGEPTVCSTPERIPSTLLVPMITNER